MKPDRIRDFAATLAPGNIIEAIRFAVTEDDGYNICGCHCDVFNDPDFARVIIFSKMIRRDGRDYRISIICYSRKSIGDYYVRCGHHGSAIDWIISGYEKLMEESSVVDENFLPSLLYTSEAKGKSWDGVSCSFLPPHLDPTLHLSQIVNCAMMLTRQFHLSFVEYHSLMCSFAYLPGAPFYIVQAAMRSKTIGTERGRLFGYSILQEAILMWNDDGAGSG